MKLADRTIETHSAGVKSANQFSIAQTSKMFKILSDSLYSDKVMAVIRELGTNAHDAHIAAGNKNPFKVILPTTTNPSFTVRDYGTGLSQADMEELYTTYGASNKNTSNDFVGCLGLGSKSPFAYTKSFTTSSYYNGQKFTYIAAIDETGVPTLNLLSATDTDEQNGLEISFAVKQFDFTEFSQKAARVFHYFKTKPIIEGGVGFNFAGNEYSNTNIVISGTGWRVCRLNSTNILFPNPYHKINSGVIAIMGNIAYPIDIEHIVGQEKAEVADHIKKWNRSFGKADIDNWKSFVQEIVNHGLYLELDFGIGELEMDVSREGLQYTKQVVRTLREKTQEIYLEMKDTFSEKIAGAKTLIEASTLYHQMNNLGGNWGVGATWTDPNGKTHDISSGKDLEYKIKAPKNLYVFNFRSASYRSRRMIYLTDKIHYETLTGQGDGYWRGGSFKNGDLAFFFCDTKSEESAKKIVTRYCNDNDCFAYLLVDTNDHTQCREGFDQLVEDVGIENFKNVSDYKHLAQSSTTRKSTNRKSNGVVSDQDVFFVYGKSKDAGVISNTYNDATYLHTLTQDDLEDFMDSDEIVYIPMIRYGAVSGYPSLKEIHSFTIADDDFAKSLTKKIFGKTKIYAIKSAFVDKLKNKGLNLVDFNTFFKLAITDIADTFDAANKFNATTKYCIEQSNANSGYPVSEMDRQFATHMINIFGLNYEKYIKNKSLVDVIDHVLLTRFFANDIRGGSSLGDKFKKGEFSAHMNLLFKKHGVDDSLKSEDIIKASAELNILVNFINTMKHNAVEVSEYLNIVQNSRADKIKIMSCKEMEKIVKEELDKNPMLKYIVGSNEMNGELYCITGGDNPLSMFTRNRYYYGASDTWHSKMDSDSALLLRTQLSSLIS